MGKYGKGKLPPFRKEDVDRAVNHGFVIDDDGNTWRYVPSKFGKAELYCRELHLSFPLYDKQQVPIDPLRRFK